MKSTAISRPYVSLSQSSRTCAPSEKGSSLWLLMTSRVYIIVSRACIPPCGMIGPQVTESSLSWTIISPPRMTSPSSTASFFTGQTTASLPARPEVTSIRDRMLLKRNSPGTGKPEVSSSGFVTFPRVTLSSLCDISLNEWCLTDLLALSSPLTWWGWRWRWWPRKW